MTTQKTITHSQVVSLASELITHILGSEQRIVDQQISTGIVLDRNQQRARLEEEVVLKIETLLGTIMTQK
jgi:hypothetical protein